MSITDELRVCARTFLGVWVDSVSQTITFTTSNVAPTVDSIRMDSRLLAIADCIDEEHRKAIASVMNDALYHANDKDMAELGWYRALGADKQPIKFGDEVEHNGVRANVLGITFHGTTPPTVCIMRGDCWVEADELHHVKQPTVEDTLHELIGKALMLSEIDGENELVAEYAKRLTLRGDGE